MCGTIVFLCINSLHIWCNVWQWMHDGRRTTIYHIFSSFWCQRWKISAFCASPYPCNHFLLHFTSDLNVLFFSTNVEILLLTALATKLNLQNWIVVYHNSFFFLYTRKMAYNLCVAGGFIHCMVLSYTWLSSWVPGMSERNTNRNKCYIKFCKRNVYACKLSKELGKIH